MRALVVLLFLAACAPEPDAAARYPEILNQPSRGPADNIAAIGADAMCGEGETLVTEASAEGPDVGSCVAPSAAPSEPRAPE